MPLQGPLSAFGHVLLLWALPTTALAVVAGLTWAPSVRLSAASRYRVAAIAFASIVAALPAAAWWLTTQRPQVVAAALEARFLALSFEEAAQPRARDFAVRTAAEAPRRELAEAALTGPASAPPLPSVSRVVRRAVEGAAPWLGIAWLLAFALQLTRLALDTLGVRRLLRTLEAAPERRWRALFEAAGATCEPTPGGGILVGFGGHRIRVGTSTAVGVPCVVGFSRAALILPAAGMPSLTQRGGAAILRHELQHVVRRDHTWAWIHSALSPLVALHPAARWCLGLVRHGAEVACDEATVGSGFVAHELGLALLRLTSERRQALHPARSSMDGNLLDRISRLVAAPTHSIPWGRAALASVIAMGLLTPFSLASVGHGAVYPGLPRPLDANVSWLWVSVLGSAELEPASGGTLAPTPGSRIVVTLLTRDAVMTWEEARKTGQPASGAWGAGGGPLSDLRSLPALQLERLSQESSGWSRTSTDLPGGERLSLVHLPTDAAPQVGKLLANGVSEVLRASRAGGVPTLEHALREALTVGYHLAAHALIDEHELATYTAELYSSFVWAIAQEGGE